MGAVAGRLRANLSLSWRWFSYWRRRYMWLRLLILLLVFAQPIYESRKPLIRELVVLAIKGIESAKRGPYLGTRAIQHQEKKRLQRALVAHFDTNRDGRLSAGEARSLKQQTGLSREQVEGRALDVELDPLVDASHAVALLSRTRTANGIRREALTVALAARQREHEALWEEIGPDLAMQYPTARDYLRLETWRHGLAAFQDVASGVAAQLPVPDEYFAGLRSGSVVGPSAFVETVPGPWWRGLIGWGAVLLVTLFCIRRYGKGKELERRFLEEPSLAEAPCPVCGTPTCDYGALAQHRFSRACATAAVAGLTFTAAFGLWLMSFPEYIYYIVIAAFPVTGLARWFLWPREVHLVHRRPWTRVAGFAVGVVLVAGLLFSVALSSLRTWRPATPVMVVGSRPHPRPGERRRERKQGRPPPRESSPPPMARSSARGSDAGRGLRGAETRGEPLRRAQRRERPRREARGLRQKARSSRTPRN